MRLFLSAILIAFAPTAASALSLAGPVTCVFQDDEGSHWSFVEPIEKYDFSDPTEEYDHGVLGDAIEYKSLGVALTKRHVGDVLFPETISQIADYLTITLPTGRVFEDIAPRPYRYSNQIGVVTQKLQPVAAVVVVESDSALGAQLAMYSASCSGIQKIAATPHIGRAYRWLAPAGIADFDGDGQNDIAYVETPHLGKILKIVTLKGDELVPIAPPRAGFSNHSIGEDFITSGVRECDGRVELLTPDANRTTLMAVRLEDGQIVSEATAFEPSLAGIERAKSCN